MLAIVVGLTGVGKTTVIDTAQKLGATYTVTSYGDVLLDLAQEEGLVSHRDELTELPPDKYDRLQSEVPEHINKTASEASAPVILDTHAALHTPTGYRPGLPRDALEMMDPDQLVMIRASPEEIYQRRSADTERDREQLPVETLREQQRTARQMIAAGAVFSKAPLAIINNPDGRVNAAAQELNEVLSG